MGLFDFLKSSKPNNDSKPTYQKSTLSENKSKHTQTTLENFTIEDRVFTITKDGIVELEQAYKDLSNEGKLEVILFNSAIAIWFYSSRNPNKQFDNVKYARKIVDQARTYNINKSDDELMHFIVSRLGFYVNEYNQLLEPQNIPGKMYTSFYISPLANNPEPSFDLGEIMHFKMALGIMIKWVKENTYNIG